MEHVSEHINNRTGNNLACAGKCRGVCVVFRVCIDETRTLLCFIWKAESSGGRICRPHTLLEAASFQKVTIILQRKKNDNNLHLTKNLSIL